MFAITGTVEVLIHVLQKGFTILATDKHTHTHRVRERERENYKNSKF